MIRIEIFGPNRFWVAINVEKDTRLIKVLDEVCLRKQLGSSDNYDLKHGKKILDLSFTVEMAMLPNSVRLELIKCSKPRQNSTVSIVIILSESNERLDIKTVHFESSLFDLLEIYEKDCKINLLHHSLNNFHPVLQYLKEEYIGVYALQNCTLKDLGLFSGRVSFRHKFREVNEISIQNIAHIIDKERKKIENIISKNKNNPITDLDPFSQNFENKDLLSENKEESMDLGPQQINRERDNFDTNIPSIFVDNLPSTFKMGDDISFLPTNDSIEHQEEVIGMNHQVPNNSFTDFKFPEETKGKEIYENHFGSKNSEDIEPCDRNVFIYKISHECKMSQEFLDSQVPDEFFNHTIDDLQVIYRDLKQNLEHLNEEPLMTTKLRSIESEKKLARYHLAIIRIQFPDSYVIQANFKPLESVFQIYKFINGLIEEKHSNFELYTSPPKIILNKSDTIFEANLVPLSLVYFAGPQPRTGFYLSMEARGEISSKEEADLASTNCIQSSGPSSCTSFTANKTDHKSLKISDYKVAPKWFTGSAKKKKVPTATLR